MPTPGERKSIQARILEHAAVHRQSIGWMLVDREKADWRPPFGLASRLTGSVERVTVRSAGLGDVHPLCENRVTTWCIVVQSTEYATGVPAV